jgi:hypothetical protein
MQILTASYCIVMGNFASLKYFIKNLLKHSECHDDDKKPMRQILLLFLKENYEANFIIGRDFPGYVFNGIGSAE